MLLKGNGLVKGVNFRNHTYIGDPINAVHIFNEKEVDELIFLDITATKENRCISLDTVQQIADECYMPFGVGGGITSIDQIRTILFSGAEKVVINSAAYLNPELIEEASGIFGNQSIVISIDVRKNIFGKYEVYIRSGSKKTNLKLVDYLKKIEECGAGELMITSINQEVTMSGYDVDLIKLVADRVNIPVIASGGAGNMEHFQNAVKIGKASAVAAGSFFVFYGKQKGVLINYPSKEEKESIFR